MLTDSDSCELYHHTHTTHTHTHTHHTHTYTHTHTHTTQTHIHTSFCFFFFLSFSFPFLFLSKTISHPPGLTAADYDVFIASSSPSAIASVSPRAHSDSTVGDRSSNFKHRRDALRARRTARARLRGGPQPPPPPASTPVPVVSQTQTPQLQTPHPQPQAQPQPQSASLPMERSTPPGGKPFASFAVERQSPSSAQLSAHPHSTPHTAPTPYPHGQLLTTGVASSLSLDGPEALVNLVSPQWYCAVILTRTL